MLYKTNIVCDCIDSVGISNIIINYCRFFLNLFYLLLVLRPATPGVRHAEVPIRRPHRKRSEDQGRVRGGQSGCRHEQAQGPVDQAHSRQREERLDKLTARMNEMHISTEELDWYLDTRRFGTVPHAGFGLGFERLVQFVTGMANIRDVIPFPRSPKSAEF